MDFADKYDFSLLKNEMEDIVIEELGLQLENHPDICVCQDCVLDMAALALNKTKPVYQVSLLGSMYAQSLHEGDFRSGLAKIVAEAIQKVSENPSHD
jgi:competence protein ComFB